MSSAPFATGATFDYSDITRHYTYTTNYTESYGQDPKNYPDIHKTRYESTDLISFWDNPDGTTYRDAYRWWM